MRPQLKPQRYHEYMGLTRAQLCKALSDLQGPQSRIHGFMNSADKAKRIAFIHQELARFACREAGV